MKEPVRCFIQLPRELTNEICSKTPSKFLVLNKSGEPLLFSTWQEASDFWTKHVPDENKHSMLIAEFGEVSEGTPIAKKTPDWIRDMKE